MVSAAKNMSRKSMCALAGAAALAAAVPLLVVMACGPDFEPEVFVPVVHPESTKEFSTGKLGVLQPSYARVDKVVAYRYLIGGKLSDAEKTAYMASPYDPLVGEMDAAGTLPVNQWRVARAAILKV